MENKNVPPNEDINLEQCLSGTSKDEYWKRKERMNLDDLGIGFPTKKQTP